MTKLESFKQQFLVVSYSSKLLHGGHIFFLSLALPFSLSHSVPLSFSLTHTRSFAIPRFSLLGISLTFLRLLIFFFVVLIISFQRQRCGHRHRRRRNRRWTMTIFIFWCFHAIFILVLSVCACHSFFRSFHNKSSFLSSLPEREAALWYFIYVMIGATDEGGKMYKIYIENEISL